VKSSISLGDNIRPILASIRTVPVAAKRMAEPSHPQQAIPFITLSRQPGAGAWSLARDFVQAMNAADPAAPPWTCWDRELVEKVAADNHLSTRLIDSLEQSDHSWLTDLFSGISGGAYADEAMIYHRVASSILALAQAGRVVIVGRGAFHITRKLPGGIHLRLIAPLKQRIAFIKESMNLSRHDAAEWVSDAERKRASFFTHFWDRQLLSPENFTLTINTARASTPQLIQALRAMIRYREEASVPLAHRGQ
jgi:cytidylate kinase